MLHQQKFIDILVSVGDKIEKDNSLADMESDKAAFELPSDISGVIKDIKVSKGDDVSVGQVLSSSWRLMKRKKDKRSSFPEQTPRKRGR
jgi:glycine cleavage system H lipoate-binding protein